MLGRLVCLGLTFKGRDTENNKSTRIIQYVDGSSGGGEGGPGEVGSPFLTEGAKGGCSDKRMFEQSPQDSEGTRYGNSWGKRSLGGGTGKSKGPEVGMCGRV